MRALIALGALAALTVILWLFYNSQPHPLGSLGYDYLHEFPGFLATLALAGAFVTFRMVFGARKRN